MERARRIVSSHAARVDRQQRGAGRRILRAGPCCPAQRLLPRGQPL